MAVTPDWNDPLDLTGCGQAPEHAFRLLFSSAPSFTGLRALLLQKLHHDTTHDINTTQVVLHAPEARASFQASSTSAPLEPVPLRRPLRPVAPIGTSRCSRKSQFHFRLLPKAQQNFYPSSRGSRLRARMRATFPERTKQPTGRGVPVSRNSLRTIRRARDRE